MVSDLLIFKTIINL